MKSINLLFLTLLLLSTKVAVAQDLNGKLQLGGTGAFFYDQTEEDYAVHTLVVEEELKNRIFLVSPQIGYFLNSQISIGGSLGYSNEKDKVIRSFNGDVGPAVEVSTNLFEVGPYIRFHKPLNDQLYLFLQGNIELGVGTNKYGAIENFQNTENTIDDSILKLEVGCKPGFLVLLSDRFGIESSFGFLGYKLTRTKLKDTDIDPNPTNTDQEFGLNLNLRTFNLGLQFYL